MELIIGLIKKENLKDNCVISVAKEPTNRCIDSGYLRIFVEQKCATDYF